MQNYMVQQLVLIRIADSKVAVFYFVDFLYL